MPAAAYRPPPLPDDPTVSVLLYVKNAAATVARALDSIAEQDYPRREIVVIDGASTDGTREILESFANRIGVLVSEPDSGGAEAANKALARAGGDIVAYVMADDWLAPGALTAIVAAFRRAPDAVLITAGAAIVEEEAPARFATVREMPGSTIPFVLATLLDVPMGAARFWRRDALAALGGFDGAYRYGHDRDLMVRGWLAGMRGATIEDVLYFYRRHAGSRTLGGDRRVIRAFLEEHWRMSRAWLATPGINSQTRRAIRRWRADQQAEAAILALGDGEATMAFRFALAGLVAEPCFAPALARRLAARVRERVA